MLMACGEIIGWPMVAFRLSSALFMVLVGAAAAALALFGLLSWLRRPALPSVREDAPAARRIALLLALAAVALELVMTACHLPFRLGRLVLCQQRCPLRKQLRAQPVRQQHGLSCRRDGADVRLPDLGERARHALPGLPARRSGAVPHGDAAAASAAGGVRRLLAGAVPARE